jgi:TolA-binding protein
MALAALLSGDREQAGRQLDAALAGPNDGSAYRDALELVFLMRGAPATNQMIRLARSRIAEACGGMESAASNQADLAGLSHAAFWKERAWLAEALALQAAGRIDGALAGFRRLSGPLAPHGLYRRAALLRRLPGREGEAAETFMDLIARYPASPYLFEARRFLAEQP